MKFSAIRDLELHLATAFGIDTPTVQTELCPSHFEGDVTVNCFRLTRACRRKPQDITDAVLAFLQSHNDVAAVDAVKAFVNVTLTAPALFRDTVSDTQALLDDALLPEGERKRVLIEFSAPNTNKPQHLGHVRNNTIGQAMAAILGAVGHTVIPVNLVNDRGIHICKSMLAYQRWGDGMTPEKTGKKGDHLVGDFYVRFDKELRKQLADLRESQPELLEKTDEELFLDTEIGRAAQNMLIAWEAGDKGVRDLWSTMNRWVLGGFAETYARMGVQFRKTYLESETYNLGKDVVSEGLTNGHFERREDGAVFMDLKKEKLDQKVVLRSDGTSVYITQDLGTTLLKQGEHSPDMQIWVVGDEQIYHFKVLFAILKRLGYAWADDLHHMAYGMVNLPSGKMKSREGTVVDADDLFDEMTRLAREATLERVGDDVPEDLDERAAVIGMGAIKFMLLKVNPKTTILFDPEASIRFEGDTGPYVLYAYARICSMLRKAAGNALDSSVDWTVLGTAEEKDLALRCAGFGEIIQRAAAELDTSCLAGYLLDLAKSFSRFYRECPVLTAPSPELQRARLGLSRSTQAVLQAGLRALTIGTLESM